MTTNNKPMFFAMTLETAEEYFDRCLDKEAVTEKERLAIIQELSDEGKLLLAGELESRAGQELNEFFQGTNKQGIVMLKQKGENDEA